MKLQTQLFLSIYCREIPGALAIADMFTLFITVNSGKRQETPIISIEN